MTPTQEHIDCWLLERILQEGCFTEIRNLEQQIKEGLRVKDDKGRYVAYESIKKKIK